MTTDAVALHKGKTLAMHAVALQRIVLSSAAALVPLGCSHRPGASQHGDGMIARASQSPQLYGAIRSQSVSVWNDTRLRNLNQPPSFLFIWATLLVWFFA